MTEHLWSAKAKGRSASGPVLGASFVVKFRGILRVRTRRRLRKAQSSRQSATRRVRDIVLTLQQHSRTLSVTIISQLWFHQPSTHKHALAHHCNMVPNSLDVQPGFGTGTSFGGKGKQGKGKGKEKGKAQDGAKGKGKRKEGFGAGHKERSRLQL